MKKRLICLLVVLSFLSVSQYCSASEYVDKLGAVVEEVSLLNLLRGLYLSKEQTEKMAKLAIDAKKIRDEALVKLKKNNSMPVFKELRDKLYTALAEKPPKIREKAVELDNLNHEIAGEVLDKIAKMEQEIKLILSPGQLDIFWEFAPCVVPELDFENPARAGQAAAPTRLMPVVELIRSMSDKMWKKHGQSYLDHMLKIIEQEAGVMTDDVREDMRRRLVKQAWKVRQMGEADYMLRKTSLAAGFMLVNREETFRSSHRKTGKIARFFLSDAAAKVFPKWLKVHSKYDKAPKKKCISPTEKSNCKVKPTKSSKLPVKITDEDKYFWEVQVPESISRLSETPYFVHMYYAFPKNYTKQIFDEDNKYVDKYALIRGLAPILTGKGNLRYYTLIEGEP